jgi:hypothetical protein
MMALALLAFTVAFAGALAALWLAQRWGMLDDPLATPGGRNDRRSLLDEGRCE